VGQGGGGGSEVGWSGLPRGSMESSAARGCCGTWPVGGSTIIHYYIRGLTRGTILGIYNVQGVTRMGPSCPPTLVLASEPLLNENERDKHMVNDCTALRCNFQGPFLYVKRSTKFGKHFLTRQFNELKSPKRSVSVHGTTQTRSHSLWIDFHGGH